MQSLSKYNKGNKYLLCAIDLFSKYVWVIPKRNKKGVGIVNVFQKIISKGRKSNGLIKVANFIIIFSKIFWKQITLKCIEHTMKENLLLLGDSLGHWRTRFLNTWQLFQKNVYFDVLDDIVHKYNNAAHRTIKMKPIDVTDDSYTEYNEDFNKKRS